MRRKKIIKINRGDYNRIILSETSPFEVPIIFSNEGFYRKISSGKKFKTLQCLIGVSEEYFQKPKIPYKYKIKKGVDSIRILSLLHPASQIQMVDFYRTYGRLICYYTSKSTVSLRTPISVGSSFLHKSDNASKINKFRSNKISILGDEPEIVHTNSYFSYKGYDRLYKFFDSEEMLTYEKKFSILWLLDISKCFASIYTHAISWATKNKEFTKQFKKANSFGSNFDKLMQNSNHGETNGILIGPEISRVFAEIIFQRIDRNVTENLLNRDKLQFGSEYVFRRYVDDYFVYANSESLARIIETEIADELSKYNLYFNELKIEKYHRPFFTAKSKVIQDVKVELKLFYDKFLIEKKINNKEGIFFPLEIHHLDELKRSLIHRVKSVCSERKESFQVACGYIISSLRNRTLDVMDGYSHQVLNEDKHKEYKDSLLMILESSFYFYTLVPSVNSSYKLSQIIILINRFFQTHFFEHTELIAQRTVELAIEFLSNAVINDRESAKFIPLEKLNVLLAISELGKKYLLPKKIIELLFKFDNDDLSYFELMSFLYYVKDYDEYSLVKRNALTFIKRKLSFLEKINESAELTYLFLDLVVCPYIDRNYRKTLISDLLKVSMPSIIFSESDIENELSVNETDDWFINWKEVDLLVSLEKKELELSYG